MLLNLSFCFPKHDSYGEGTDKSKKSQTQQQKAHNLSALLANWNVLCQQQMEIKWKTKYKLQTAGSKSPANRTSQYDT